MRFAIVANFLTFKKRSPRGRPTVKVEVKPEKASFPEKAFVYTLGSPASYRSSPGAVREFCPKCGTQIAFREDGAGTVDFNVASLDRPAALSPQYHIWTESRIPWFETADALPRHRDEGPDGAS